MGSYTLSAQWRGWVPAYWKPHEQDQVVDVTGGGNAWLGGLCAGLSLSDGDIRYGMSYLGLRRLIHSIHLCVNSCFIRDPAKRTSEFDNAQRRGTLERG